MGLTLQWNPAYSGSFSCSQGCHSKWTVLYLSLLPFFHPYSPPSWVAVSSGRWWPSAAPQTWQSRPTEPPPRSAPPRPEPGWPPQCCSWSRSAKQSKLNHILQVATTKAALGLARAQQALLVHILELMLLRISFIHILSGKYSAYRIK